MYLLMAGGRDGQAGKRQRPAGVSAWKEQLPAAMAGSVGQDMRWSPGCGRLAGCLPGQLAGWLTLLGEAAQALKPCWVHKVVQRDVWLQPLAAVTGQGRDRASSR